VGNPAAWRRCTARSRQEPWLGSWNRPEWASRNSSTRWGGRGWLGEWEFVPSGGMPSIFTTETLRITEVTERICGDLAGKSKRQAGRFLTRITRILTDLPESCLISCQAICAAFGSRNRLRCPNGSSANPKGERSNIHNSLIIRKIRVIRGSHFPIKWNPPDPPDPRGRAPSTPVCEKFAPLERIFPFPACQPPDVC